MRLVVTTLHVRLRLHVDTVQELTDILVLDGAQLVENRSFAGHRLEVVALQHKLVLHLGGIRAVHLDALREREAAHTLLTKEVADLNNLLLNVHVDRKVSICEAELEAEALRHTRAHVANVRQGSVDGGDVQLRAEPASGGESAGLLVVVEVQLEVTQVLLEGTALARDGHNAVLDGNGHVRGDGEAGEGLDLHVNRLSDTIFFFNV